MVACDQLHFWHHVEFIKTTVDASPSICLQSHHHHHPHLLQRSSMSTVALSSSTSRPPHSSRSLPVITVFSHPAARLIKTVPQLQPPTRINAHITQDTLGVGRTSPSDLVLTDVYGPLSLLVVPDPLDASIATLVLSVGFHDPNLQGAARRFVLPFRSFKRDPISGQLVSQSQIDGFDAADRTIYPGLGAGLKGLDGGSFWFFEDIGEHGALDRFRWESHKVARRAIWTVWLISTPAPVVLHLQNLLQSYPATVPSLPPWLKERNGYPWQDSYLVHMLPPSLSAEQHQPRHQPTSPTLVPTNLAPADAAAIAIPLDHIAATTLPDTDQQPCANSNPGSSLSVRANPLGNGSTSISIGDAPKVILRAPNRTPPPPSQYRNSLVAVDNLTGQIVGVLASHVDLGATTDSSDDVDADADEQDEAKTPLDEQPHFLHETTTPHALGLHNESKLLPELPPDLPHSITQADSPTPRTSTTVNQNASVYHIPADVSDTCRPPSILAADTFSPPPLPIKQQSPTKREAVPSRPTSAVSAAFFTAESDLDTMSTYDSDALEIDASTITHDRLCTSITTIPRNAAANDVERHRPELLRDLVLNDDDAASDASGSTVGGPALRMWRKARGKSKNKLTSPATAAADNANDSKSPIKSCRASESSHRTSNAETALETFSDDEMAEESQLQQHEQKSVGDDRTRAELNLSRRSHLARSAMCTDQVRHIEDRIWREALEGGHLPIDAPYTHLAARGNPELYSSSIVSSARSITDGSAIELLSVDHKAPSRERKRRQHTQRAERHNYMQGGTVLIEFLAGSSRIGASLIRSAGLVASGKDEQSAAQELTVQGSSGTAELALNVLDYVPLLPQHLLSFFGLSSSSHVSGTAPQPPRLTASSSTSYLPSLSLPSLPDWFTNFFGFGSSTVAGSSATEDETVETMGDPSKAEEWEYAIPEFDPNSLFSTPRPVYRRKRPVPCAMNGFSISAAAPSCASNATDDAQLGARDAATLARSTPETAAANSRYSILHFDSLGVGRRAFLRGMPAVNAACF